MLSWYELVLWSRLGEASAGGDALDLGTMDWTVPSTMLLALLSLPSTAMGQLPAPFQAGAWFRGADPLCWVPAGCLLNLPLSGMIFQHLTKHWHPRCLAHPPPAPEGLTSFPVSP